MSDLLKLIQEADVVALEMERSKAAVELAKQSLETAKENFEQARKSFEEVLVKADAIGVPRIKVRKLIEERTLALVASGLINGDSRPATPKVPKSPRKTPKAFVEGENLEDSVTNESVPMEII